MTDWKENMRRIEDAARQVANSKQVEISLEQLNKRLESQKAAELRSIAERQEERNRLKYFKVLDDLEVREMLEGINQQMWRGRGTVVEDSMNTDKGMEKFVRLSFEYQTTIPEIETKKWDVKVGRGSETVYHEGGSSSHSYDIREERNKTKVVKEYKVIKPSYLEVGVDYQTKSYATLYILDTEVNLPTLDGDKTFSDLARKTGGGAPISYYRTIWYTDTNGSVFDKRPHPTDLGVGSGWLTGRDISKSYSLANSHSAHGAEIDLSPEPDIKALKNFVTYGLALSCSLRTSQGKLPFQLK